MLKLLAWFVNKFWKRASPALPDLEGVGSIVVTLAQQELKAAIEMEAALVASGGYVAFWLDPRRYSVPWDKWLTQPYSEPEPIVPLPGEGWKSLESRYAMMNLQDSARAAQQMAYDDMLQRQAAAGLLQSAANQHFHNIHRPTSKKRFDVRYGLSVYKGLKWDE